MHYEKLEHTTLEPTSMCLQLADQPVRHPLGIDENIPVKIRDFLVLVDFVVLDMSSDSKVSIILVRPFLSIANAHIDVGKGEIKFNINGKEEHFTFKPRPEGGNTGRRAGSTIRRIHGRRADPKQLPGHHVATLSHKRKEEEEGWR